MYHFMSVNDGTRAGMTSFDLEAYRLHFQSLSKPKELLGHRSKVQCLAWSEDGEKLASGSAEGSIRIWSMEKIASSILNDKSSTKFPNNLSVELTAGHTRNVNQVQWYPFNSNVLASGSNDKTVKIWDISQEQPNILTIQTEIEILTLSWHSSKPILAVGTKDDRILFYQLTDNFLTYANLMETLKFNSEVNEISWSANGNELAVALGIGIVEIYRFDSNKFEKSKTLKAHTADCFCVRFKGNDLLAVGSSDAQITLWSRASNDDFMCFRVFNRMEWPIRTLSFSHDSEFLAVGSEDPFIAIEHINTGSLVAKVSTGKASSEAKAGIPINSVAWHPSKHILAFAGSEVDDRTGKPTGSIKLFGLC